MKKQTFKICMGCDAPHINDGNYCDDCLIEWYRERDQLYRDFDRYGNNAL